MNQPVDSYEALFRASRDKFYLPLPAKYDV